MALELLYRPRDSLGILRGSSTLSNETLGQICRQLKEIIKQRTDVNESNLLWPLVSDLSLSVLNPDPRFLHGVERLHQVLEEHASKDAIALDHLGSDGNRQRFSYSTVDWLSTALALKLQSILRRPQSTNGARSHVVPILVPQTPELYIALIAILKAGAAFCPLNADAPKERVKFVARDVAADLIITTTANESLVSWDHGPEIFLLDNLDDIEMGQELPPLANVTADSLAYMMYTSGSTGKPKGVGISHMAVCQAILAHQEHIPTFDRLLQFAAPTFDVFVFEVFFTLFRGSTVVSCNRQEMLGDLPGTINRLEVDAVELTPTVVTGLLRTRASVPRLRLLLTIGEKLTNPIVKGFGESPQQNGILYGMYGPTEATIHCTLSSKMQSNHNASVIGVPLATVSSFIIEPRPLAGTSSGNFVVLPVGHIGELAIGGYQLTNGYNNRPEQNAQAFIDTPQHGRVYRTGDKARQLPGGELEYLGRLTSEQVKLRGQRLELGEIEDVLRSARGITNATAALIDDVLVAFCFTESDDITRHNVAEKCRLWLPRSMVPGDLVLLHEVPRLPSGKIDKGKLESDYRSGHNTMLSDQSSLDDDTEQHIADVARELLGDRYAGSKSLAAAGLDSLTAIRFTTRLQELGLNVGAVDILNADSVKDIGVLAKKNQLPAARRCVDDGDDRREDHASFRGIAMDQVRAVANPADIVDIIRCTPIQIAMLAETAINSQAYCNWIEVELPAKVSYLDVESALRRMATENEILRSGFLFLEGPPATYAQIIWTELSSSQLDTVSVFDRHFALNSIQSLLRPLRFSTACIDGRLHLLVQIHHALYDGWTWEHILSDLELILTNHNPPHRPQYRNIVDYFSKASKPNTNKPSLEFWTTQLNGLVVNPLPNFHGRNDIGQSLGFAHRKMKIIMRELEAISRELSVAPLAFFQAALAYLLSSYLGSSDIVFGTVSSGRTLPVNGVEHIMGPCITALPTRLDLACSQTVADLVRFLHRANRESLEHSAISLREIKRVTGIESGKLLFDVLIVWQQTTRPISSTPRLVTEINKADFLEYKLTLEIEPSRECIVVKANYQQAVFPHAQVDLILDQIDQLVECMALSAAKTLDEVGQCFGEGSLSIQNPLIQRPSDQETLTSCFERTAREDPQRAAIDFARLIVGNKIDLETLSYKRLNQRANQLAHFLLSQHVPTTGPVCICMEKSTALYISILAVIKAGLGYLPLTPETPPGRLQHILIEADVKLCLTTPTVRDTVRDTNDIHFFDAENLDCGNYPNTNLSLKYDGSNLAYAVFTSGSTGAPKGVLVTYENLRSNLSVLKAVYPMSRASRLLQSCSQAFDGKAHAAMT